MKVDIGFADGLLCRALKAGADQAEVYVRSSKNLSVEVKDQAVDSLKSSVSFGYSLRLIRKGRPGFSYATSVDDMDAVVASAINSSGVADEDGYLDLPEGGGTSDVAVYDPAVPGLKEEDAIAKVMLIESSCRGQDRRISKVRKASGSFSQSETAIVNSRSVRAIYRSTSCSGQIMAVAEEAGDSQSGWDFQAGRFLKDITFDEIGRNAARRAVSLLGAKRCSVGRAEVLLDNSVTVDFLGIFASTLSSEAVQKGKSLLAGKRGSRVISPKVSIEDSGLLTGRIGSSPADAEGVPTRAKRLIEEGVLLTYLYNTYTGRKDGTASTGNAVRGGFATVPSVGITNLMLEASSAEHVMPVKEIISSIKKGLLVLDAMGVHTANPISGDFSVGVTGLWIEDGETRFPVKEAVVSGNILEFFDKIVAVGDDLTFFGNMAGPSLLIRDIDISA